MTKRKLEAKAIPAGRWVKPRGRTRLPAQELPYQPVEPATYNSIAGDDPDQDSAGAIATGRKATTWDAREDVLSRPLPVVSFHFLEDFQVEE